MANQRVRDLTTGTPWKLLFVNCLRMTIQGLGFSGVAVIAGVLEMLARGGVDVLLVPVFGFNAVSIGSPAAWVFANIFLIPTYLNCMRKLETRQKSMLKSTLFPVVKTG